jgi:hypothetical protein
MEPTASESSSASCPLPIAGDKLQLESAAKALVAGVGLAYGTGFVVVLTFLNSYGIGEAGGEVLKPRYIYVGALCLACPVALLSVLLGLFSRRHTVPSAEAARSVRQVIERLITPAENMPLPLIVMISNLMVVSYCIVAFARPGLFAARQTLFICLYVPILVTLVLRLIFGEAALWSRPLNMFRWGLVAASLVVSVFILREIDFASMFREGVLNYIVLQLLFVFFVYRFTKWRRLGSSAEARAARLTIRLMVLGSLFVVGVLSFAHTVFNHIPAAKGGGDFSDAADSQVCFSDASRVSVPSALLPNGDRSPQPLCSVLVKIIEETSSDIYVARSTDRGGRRLDQARNAAVLWRAGEYYPVVFQISRTAVAIIVRLNHSGVGSFAQTAVWTAPTGKGRQ